MTNSYSKMDEELNETQKSLTKVADIAKVVPEKIKQIVEEKNKLKAKNDELIKTKIELNEKINKLEGELSGQRNEFEKKIASNENRIVSLERELELSKDENSKLITELEEKNNRIEILESQKVELTQSLRDKSM
jgi:chromosome segregation ATPase